MQLKKLLAGTAAFLAVLSVSAVSVYYLLPGTVLGLSTDLARFSAGLKRHEVRAAGHNWVYLEGGKGKAIVFVHGFGLSKDQWGAMLPALVKSNRILVPDLPGFGETAPVLGEHYTVKRQAARLDEFVNKIGLKSFHLVGLSMGGAIAGYYSAEHPGKVKSLVMIGPFGVRSDALSDFQKAYAKGENPLVLKDVSGFDVAVSYGRSRPDAVPDRFKSYIAGVQSKKYDFYIDAFRDEIDSGGWDMLRPHLNRIKAPVLVIFGDRDRVIDASCMDTYRKGIGNVRTALIKGAGHIAYLDSPGETIGLVRDFLDRNKDNK
ncbi:MAG: alpha/beta hydrolase [Spirochaetes bacterium]|nr:alpha/beta hydrolase [Spirochaetota bacterium]